jgi:hypothetical protein
MVLLLSFIGCGDGAVVYTVRTLSLESRKSGANPDSSTAPRIIHLVRNSKTFFAIRDVESTARYFSVVHTRNAR